MHELSLCRAIASLTARAAAGRPVKRIGLRVGALRQVVPDTLVAYWGMISQGTPLAGSVLDVESVAAQIRCTACGHTHRLAEPVLRCDACESTDVTVVAGEELLVTTIDLAEA